jgi:hypothetical protein
MFFPSVAADIHDLAAGGFYWSTTIPSQNEYETRCSSNSKGGVCSPDQSHSNFPSFRQLRVTDTVHGIPLHLISHTQI